MNNNETFFDGRTLMAIFLVVATFFGWRYYMQAKYPQIFEKKAAETVAPTDAGKPANAPAAESAASNPAATSAPAMKVETPSPEKSYNFHSDELSFQISSKGMGVSSLKLLKYTNRKGESVEFSRPKPPLSFETRLMGTNEPIDFAIEKISDRVWVGHAQLGALNITKTMEIDPAKYAFDVKVAVQGQDSKFAGLTTSLSDVVEPQEGGNFLTRSQYDRQEAFVDAGTSHNNHIYISGPVDQTWQNGHVVALGSAFFAQAIVDHSGVIPEVKLHVDPANHTGVIHLSHPVLNKSESTFNIHFTGFAGPKSMALLKSIDEDMVPIIDFGFFSSIARYILVVLKWFQSLVGNWGVSIILLTILVRLIVAPFNIMSYRSMKAMQAIQPKMQAARERYKDDQQKQNQAVMELMREHKVNPLGGCLPVLLQLPIFWALYQVLGHSIELYQAPFALWINDLSLKDPFYVLPVLMGITMFLQQKMTPNTMDPAQAKIMMFMPLMFSVFMINLPSGLTLYIWVSALFAVVQQYYFMKSHNRLVESK